MKNRIVKEEVDSQNIQVHRMDKVVLPHVGIVSSRQLFRLQTDEIGIDVLHNGKIGAEVNSVQNPHGAVQAFLLAGRRQELDKLLTVREDLAEIHPIKLRFKGNRLILQQLFQKPPSNVHIHRVHLR